MHSDNKFTRHFNNKLKNSTLVKHSGRHLHNDCSSFSSQSHYYFLPTFFVFITKFGPHKQSQEWAQLFLLLIRNCCSESHSEGSKWTAAKEGVWDSVAMSIFYFLILFLEGREGKRSTLHIKDLYTYLPEGDCVHWMVLVYIR